MKKLLLSALLAVGFLQATDFSAMSTEELSALRGTVATEERDAFRSEWQSRAATMTPEQRAEYGMGASKGNGNGQKLRDGSGLGSQSKGANRGSGRR